VRKTGTSDCYLLLRDSGPHASHESHFDQPPVIQGKAYDQQGRRRLLSPRVFLLIFVSLVGGVIWLATKSYVVSELLSLLAFMTVLFVLGTIMLLLLVFLQEAASWCIRQTLVLFRNFIFAGRSPVPQGAVLRPPDRGTEEVQNVKVSRAVTEAN